MKFIFKNLKDFLWGSSSFPGARLRLFQLFKIYEIKVSRKTNDAQQRHLKTPKFKIT